MKSLKRATDKYLSFEIVRLRTIYDKHPHIREAVAKRYREVVGEYKGRELNWFWKSHILDKLIKDEFEGYQGKWITLENGQHIFIREGESMEEAVDRLEEKPKVTLQNIDENPNRKLNLYKDDDMEINIEYNPDLEGEAEAKKGTIYLGKSWVELKEKYPKSAKVIVIHEIGHLLDQKEGVAFKNRDLFEGRVYGYIGNPFEGFAQSFAMYNSEPEDIKERFSKIYNLHRELEQDYKGYYKAAQKVVLDKEKEN